MKPLIFTWTSFNLSTTQQNISETCLKKGKIKIFRAEPDERAVMETYLILWRQETLQHSPRSLPAHQNTTSPPETLLEEKLSKPLPIQRLQEKKMCRSVCGCTTNRPTTTTTLSNTFRFSWIISQPNSSYMFKRVMEEVNTLTCYWFLIVLAQVDQVPQSWVELIHHILIGDGMRVSHLDSCLCDVVQTRVS